MTVILFYREVRNKKFNFQKINYLLLFVAMLLVVCA